jgi:hypothetical protein
MRSVSRVLPMPRVFISHASKDREFVEREIISILNKHGIETWYSTADITTAAHWEQSIRLGLKECDWFLVVLSPQSIASEWVRTEVHWALEHRQGHVVPVLFESCDPAELHLKLIQIQFVDYRDNIVATRTQLLRVWNLLDAEMTSIKASARSDSVQRDNQRGTPDISTTGLARIYHTYQFFQRVLYFIRRRWQANARDRRNVCPQCMRQDSLKDDPEDPNMLRCSGTEHPYGPCSFRYSRRLHSLPRVNFAVFGPHSSGKTSLCLQLWTSVLRGVSFKDLKIKPVSDSEALNRLGRYKEISQYSRVNREIYEQSADQSFVTFEVVFHWLGKSWSFLLNVSDCRGGEYFGSERYEFERRRALFADGFLVVFDVRAIEPEHDAIVMNQIVTQLYYSLQRDLGRNASLPPIAVCLNKIDLLDVPDGVGDLLDEMRRTVEYPITLSMIEKRHRQWVKASASLFNGLLIDQMIQRHFGHNFRIFPISAKGFSNISTDQISCVGLFKPLLWLLHTTGNINLPRF